MAYLIYKLSCAVSGKAYVGMTARALDTRWLEHCARARQGVREGRLSAAIRKYGAEAFQREILGTADTEDQARSLETHFIRELGTQADGYNCNEGGAGWLHIPSDVRRKIGDAQRGKIISAASRERMAAAKRANPAPERLGAHLLKGAANPRAKTYSMKFPDGSVHAVTGLRAFCREAGASNQVLRKGFCSRGYSIVQQHRSNDAVAVEALTDKGVA